MIKAEIQLVRSLDDKRSREETGLFVAEGTKLVRELADSGLQMRKVYYTEGSAIPPAFVCRPSAGLTDWSAEQVSPKEMERMSRLKTATECLALVEIPRRAFDPAAIRGQLVLALDGVQNPGNAGTIIRLADWFGIRTVLCSADSADLFNPKVVQATMGAVAHVEVHYGDLAAMIAAVGGPVYGTFLEGRNIYETELTAEGIVVLGSEGRGISAEVEATVSRRLFIPSFPPENLGPESLNVAVAAAIVCSEFSRRQ